MLELEAISIVIFFTILIIVACIITAIVVRDQTRRRIIREMLEDEDSFIKKAFKACGNRLPIKIFEDYNFVQDPDGNWHDISTKE